VALTDIFWCLFCVPGLALVRRVPALAERCYAAGLLYTLAVSCIGTLLLLSPCSLLCYALGAPLAVFSGFALFALAVGAFLLARERADRELLRMLRREPLLPFILLLALTFLQLRRGGWLDGDATFHLGRIRVLLEHGFSNRDIYLAVPHFQHVYHSNLLFPVYAAAAQLTGESYLRVWFHSEAFAKLLVAAGHFVLAYALSGSRRAGLLLALCMTTANAGETYALYPNTLAVGYLLPTLLGLGLQCLGPARERGWVLLPMAALDFVLAQIHALYAVYAALLLAPVLLLALLWRRSRSQLALVLGALLALAPALPFVLVSTYGFQAEPALTVAADENSPSVPAAPALGNAAASGRPIQAPALAAGGGHLEKVMERIDDEHVVFSPSRMGGRWFVVLGLCALVACPLLLRGPRAPLLGAGICALLLAATLFTVQGATAALDLLKTPFVVARLSTVLTTLLFLGICTLCALLTERLALPGRSFIQAGLYLGLVGAAACLLGHAPVSFGEHVRAALAGRDARYALLEQLEERRALLQSVVPRGATVLTTARFARQVVMLYDCYVLAADRGHTRVFGIDKRRKDLVLLNAADTSWPVRSRLLTSYSLRLVTFENRWRRRYQWAYDHGRLLGRAAGLDVIQLYDSQTAGRAVH
jgi:hypothetical protein